MKGYCKLSLFGALLCAGCSQPADQPEPEVVELLREIRRKRFTREAVTAYVDKRLGDDGRRRLNACLGRIGA